MDLPQIAPLPTERALIHAGIAELTAGRDPSGNQRAVMLRWIRCVPDELVDRVLAETPTLRLVRSG